MSMYDPVQVNRRLWNSPKTILHESLIGTAMLHKNLLYLENCRAILRRDYSEINGKVRIIGGGAVIDGLIYSGFVGPGMLTAVVHGLDSGVASIPTSDSIFDVIKYIVKDKETEGILLLLHDCPEYFLSFLEAKSKAEGMNLPIKMILVRDEINDKLNIKPMSPRSPSGLIFIYKIAGAMSEEGRSLDEVYNLCNQIIKSGIIFSIAVYISNDLYSKTGQIEMCRGDRLSDRDIKRFPVDNFSAQKVIENLINDLKNVDNYNKFPPGCKLALLFDYFGAFTELERNIVMKELIQQMNQFQFEIEVIYIGGFHTSMETTGFHLSILNLSNDLQLLHYLNLPTSVFSWPKAIDIKITFQINKKEETESSNNMKNINLKETQKMVSLDVDVFETDLLLTALTFGCEALIACASKIDMLDSITNENFQRCGTRLANSAKAIQEAIYKKTFTDSNLSHIFFQVASIFEKNIEDPQAEMYTIFFNAIGKTIQEKRYIQNNDWRNAFVNAIISIDHITKNTILSATFFAAKSAFCNVYMSGKNINILQAFERAASAAQEQTAHIIIDAGRIPESSLKDEDCGYTGLAGAHALGTWMRGAYEGIKLKYSKHTATSGEKRTSSNFSSDDTVVAKISKQ